MTDHYQYAGCPDEFDRSMSKGPGPRKGPKISEWWGTLQCLADPGNSPPQTLTCLIWSLLVKRYQHVWKSVEKSTSRVLFHDHSLLSIRYLWLAVSNPYPYRFQDKRRFRSNKKHLPRPCPGSSCWTGLVLPCWL